MSQSIELVLDRLRGLGFHVERGAFAPFGEPSLPEVSAVAWDERTAQLLLVADMATDGDEEAWRQVLFAASGLRHHLARDTPPAFGTPLVLAIVDRGTSSRLRRLAERLSADYVLFTRVDLNLVEREDITNPELLDDALAPLLPRCRDLLGSEIAKAEVGEFWRALVASVRAAADGLDPLFAAFASEAADKAVSALVGQGGGEDELPAPEPIRELTLENFRSVGQTRLDLGPVTIVHGPNGSGKSSLLEALELDWAGTSQRRPPGVDADDYQRHLVRDTAQGFRITADGRETTTVSDSAHAELARCVLTHEAVAKLVSDTPEERYMALIKTTGLEIPDIGRRIDDLVIETKRYADKALSDAGLQELPRRNTVPQEHLRLQLGGSFAPALPDVDAIVGAERALSVASGDVYQGCRWPGQQDAMTALMHAEQAVSRVLAAGTNLARVSAALDTAADALVPLRDARREHHSKVNGLISAIRRTQRTPVVPPTGRETSPPIPPDLAARWLAHARSAEESAVRFEREALSLKDEAWSAALREYSSALEQAAKGVPQERLKAASRSASLPSQQAEPLSERVFMDAGFSTRIDEAGPLLAHLDTLSQVLSRQVAALTELEETLRDHPSRTFEKHASMVLGSLSRFSLARELKQHSPMENAGEQIVNNLLQSRLAPAVRELVAAVVRFEWHFKPLIVPERGRTVVLGGLATSRPDLDARLLLNSAERTVLGLAWFMALHLLQPTSRRQVLVLDDPTAAFDTANQAGFTSTLRAFVRLTRPKQVVVSTHDDAAAAVLAEELAPVDGWPAMTTRVRVQRDNNDLSVVTPMWTSSQSRSLAGEVERLGLGAEPALGT